MITRPAFDSFEGRAFFCWSSWFGALVGVSGCPRERWLRLLAGLLLGNVHRCQWTMGRIAPEGTAGGPSFPREIAVVAR